MIAELVMEEIEEKALASAPVKPRWWRRYVDDSNACLKDLGIRAAQNTSLAQNQATKKIAPKQQPMTFIQITWKF